MAYAVDPRHAGRERTHVLAGRRACELRSVSLTIPDPFAMSQEVISELAPKGVLRAGINLGNFLLVSGSSPAGEPEGVAPDLAREIAARLGVGVAYVPFARPGELADAAGQGIWDIGLIAAEPARAKTIAFTPPMPRSRRPTWCPRARR